MKHQKLLILLFLLCFVKGFAFENKYRIKCEYENYTPFADSEPIRNTVRTRAVTHTTDWWDYLNYWIGGNPQDGTYVYNANGELIKITEEDFKAFQEDKNYADYIRNGGYYTYAEYTPLDDELVFLGLILTYYLWKKLKKLQNHACSV